MPTAIALLIFAAWLAFAFLKPKTAFSFLPFALPFYLVRLSIGPLPTTALEMVALATIAAWLSHVVINKDSSAPKGFFARGLAQNDKSHPWILPCGLWLLAGAISVIIAPDRLAALGLYRAYFVEPVLLFFVGIGLMCQKESPASRSPLPASLIRNLFLVTIFFGLWAIFQYATGIGLPAEYAPPAIRRAVGPFPYPNALALFVVPVTAFAMGIGGWGLGIGQKDQNSTSKTQLFTWVTVIAGLTAVVLAKSDGGLIALIAAAFVALLMNKRTRLAAIAVAVVGAIAIFAIPQIRTPVMDQILFREWSGKVRVIMWKETFAMLKDHPVFGAGLSAYPAAIAPYHKAAWMEIFQYPHNILLNLWSETGVLGVAAFGWLLWTWASGRWPLAAGQKYGQKPKAESRKLHALALPIIAALLVHGLVDVPYFKNDLAILFFLLILATSNNEAIKQWSHSAD